MKTTVIYSLIYLFGVLISAFAQIILKKSANKEHGSFIKEYLNVRVIVAYGIFFSATLCTVFSLKGIPLSFAPILGATEYAFITVLSVLLLHEKVSVRKLCGLALIVVGVIVFAL